MTESLDVKTTLREELVDITALVRGLIRKSGIAEGMACIYCPHTTAGITINEKADPDVVHDMLHQLDEMMPWKQSFYRHREGNSASHVKASMMGSSVTVLIESGRLVLGTWQGIFLCEFDGPRTRKVLIKVIED